MIKNVNKSKRKTRKNRKKIIKVKKHRRWSTNKLLKLIDFFFADDEQKSSDYKINDIATQRKKKTKHQLKRQAYLHPTSPPSLELHPTSPPSSPTSPPSSELHVLSSELTTSQQDVHDPLEPLSEGSDVYQGPIPFSSLPEEEKEDYIYRDHAKKPIELINQRLQKFVEEGSLSARQKYDIMNSELFKDFVKEFKSSAKNIDEFAEEHMDRSKNKEVHWPLIVMKSINDVEDEYNSIFNVPLMIKKSNYIGPNTDLMPRLIRGRPGLTESDRSAKAHDIDYSLIKELYEKDVTDVVAGSRDEEVHYNNWVNEIRISDSTFTNRIKAYMDQTGDYGPNNMVPYTMMRLKMLAEDLNLISPEKFVFTRKKKLSTLEVTKAIEEAF